MKGRAMKRGLVALLVGGVLVLLLVVAGVMHFTKSEDEINVRIDTGKIEQAAEKTAEKGKESLQQAGEALKRFGERATKHLDDDKASPPASDPEN